MNPDLSPIPKPPLTIYVANMAEDVWQLINTLPPKHKALDIRGCDLTSDRELSAFLNTPNFMLVSPVEVDAEFIAYMNNLKPKEYLEILVPTVKTGQISLDILNDHQILDRIFLLSDRYAVRLESYTSSSEFIKLAEFLTSKNPTITAPLTPNSKDQGVVDYFGSKSGLRSFYEKNQSQNENFVMSKGKVCFNKKDAINYAQALYQENGGVVFKTPKGHSSIGVVIVKKHREQETNFANLLIEPYWDMFPIIVEEYVDIDHSIGGGNPNAECLIDENGQVKIMFYCGMRMDKNGYFQGIEIGSNILPKEIVEKFASLSVFLGDEYARRGYKGYFDIDGMVDEKHNLLISESNVRRTGGTHVYYLGQSLIRLGSIEHKYTVSNNYYPLARSKWNLKKILELLEPILFNKKTETGLVVAGANTLKDNFLTYVVFADSKEQAIAIENHMRELLS